MPSFKSPAWREIAEAIDQWKSEALDHVDDPGVARVSLRFDALTRRIVEWCDAETNIDGEPIWTLYCQIVAQRTGGSTWAGPKVSAEVLQATMSRCIGILGRLHKLGTTSTADSKTDRKKNSGRPNPANREVRALARLIKQKHKPGTTKLDIALEFADGDERRAKSLLRQLQPSRFGHLLK
jgi:hypothetical protein